MIDAVKFVQRFDAYFHAVGYFMHEFAQMETVVKAFYCSGIFTDEPTVEFGSKKLNLVPTLKMIEDVRRKKGLPDSAYLSRAFEQVRKLAATRNVLIHNGAHFREHLTFVSDPVKVAAGEAAEELLDVAVLRAMCQDMATIQACVMMHVLGETKEAFSYGTFINEIGLSGWLRDILSMTDMEDHLRQMDFRAELQKAACMPWMFEPRRVTETGYAPDILRRKARRRSAVMG